MMSCIPTSIANNVPCECSKNRSVIPCKCPIPLAGELCCYCYIQVPCTPCGCYPEASYLPLNLRDTGNSDVVNNLCLCIVDSEPEGCKCTVFVCPRFLDVFDSFNLPLEAKGREDDKFLFEGTGSLAGKFFSKCYGRSFITGAKMMAGEKCFDLMVEINKSNMNVWVYNGHAYFLCGIKAFVSPDTVDTILKSQVVKLPGWYSNEPLLRIVLSFGINDKWHRCWVSEKPADYPIINI
jgi:hypothetical protein